MSLINGISGLGSGLGSLAGDALKDQIARATPTRTPLLNATPSAPAESTPAPAVAPAAAPAQESIPAAAPLAGPRMPPSADSAAHGNALDPLTVERAHQIYLGLTARGMDPPTAIGFAANAVQESRADPNTQPGDMGASHGAFQWRGDRLANYTAMFGHAPEHGNLNEQLDYVMHELHGPESTAQKAILAAAPDAASRAGAVSQFFERPKDTAAEIARRSYIANLLAGRFAQMTPTQTGAVS